MRRRSSAGQHSREDVRRALGAEFGWGEESSGNNNARDSVVSTGSVAVAQARQRGDSLSTRQVSLEASISRGGSTSTSGSTAATASTVVEAMPGMTRAHSLNSVPEVHEEEAGGGGDLGLGRRRLEKGEDRQALLGGDGLSRSSSGASARSLRRIEPVEGLEDVELGNKKRRRES